MDFEYKNKKKTKWFKLLKVFMTENGENIDWNNNSNTFDVNEILKELNRKI